jgi:hypothetical protein
MLCQVIKSLGVHQEIWPFTTSLDIKQGTCLWRYLASSVIAKCDFLCVLGSSSSTSVGILDGTAAAGL